MTLGVRIALENSNGEFLLVRHTYVTGWHFPGGGVERGETFKETVFKEMNEETGISLSGDPKLKAIYFNRHASPRDHVALYHLVEDHDISDFKPNREIAELGFFPEGKLPEGVTSGTRRRIGELNGGLPFSDEW